MRNELEKLMDSIAANAQPEPEDSTRKAVCCFAASAAHTSNAE